MTPSSYKPQEPRYTEVEQCHTVPNHEGSRNYPPQGPTPREMLHYTNRAALPCLRVALPCPCTALLAAARPCPACTPPCWPPPCPSICAALPWLRAALPLPCAASPCPAPFPSARAPPCLRAALLVERHPALPDMASLSAFTFNHEGRTIQFDTWLDDLQLYLLSDSTDNVSLFDQTSGASLAPPATADSATRSQWFIRDAAARLAVRNHLPLAEHAHFGQHWTAKAMYDDVVPCCSSPATAAFGRLILPYLFPELDHFLTLDPTYLTINVLEKHLLAAETSIVAVGAACGTPCTPLFEGCSPSPLAPSYASAAAVDILGTKDVRAASDLSGKHRCGKGKGGKSGGGGSGGSGGGGGGGGGCGGGGGGISGGSGGFGGGGGGSCGSGGGSGGGSGSGGGGNGGGRGGAVHRGGSGAGQRQQQQRRSEAPTPQQLREWFAQRGSLHFGAEAESPRWLELVRSGVHIFALDYDAILAAMYALSDSAEGGRYQYVPPDQGIVVAALGASESALPGTAPAEALHTFTLDSGASSCFFCDTTTLTPLPAPVPVRLANPSRGPVLARSSTILPCPVVPSGSLSGLHLPSFSKNMVSTAALLDVMVTTTTHGDPLPLAKLVEVTVDSGVARGAAFGVAEPASAEPGGAERASAETGGTEPEGAEPGGAESKGAEFGGVEPEGAEPGGAEPEGAELGGAESKGAESGGLEPRGTASAGGPAGAGGPAAGGTGAGGAGATSPGDAGVTAGAGGTGGAGAAGPGGTRTRGTRAAGAGGVGGAGARDPGAGGTGPIDSGGVGGTGVGDPGAGGTGAGAPGAGDAGAGVARAEGMGAGNPGAGGARARVPGAGGAGARDPGAGGAGAGGAGAGGTGAGGTVQWRPFFVPPPPSSLPPPDSVLCQVLSLPSSTGLTPTLLYPLPHQS
ncbi:unnamed protein product [Closterium sp. NIES-53]